jgi:hypothetical protein
VIKKLYLAAAIGTVLTISPAVAQTPIYHWGNDTRGMSQDECMKRARFAMGEQGLQVNGETGTDVAGAGPNVAVLVSCVSLGQRTWIHVVASSLDSGTAERLRNGVRSIVMGPPD